MLVCVTCLELTQFCLSGPFPRRLSTPTLELDLRKVNPLGGVRRIAALPNGEAILNDEQHVKQINKQGQTVRVLFNCAPCHFIRGLLLLKSNLCIVYNNGTIPVIDLNTGNIRVKIYYSDVGSFTHHGSLAPDPNNIPDDLLLLCDRGHKQNLRIYALFSRIGSRSCQCPFQYPTSFSYTTSHHSYVVCDHHSHQVHLIDPNWKITTTFGGLGSANGQLNKPEAAIVIPDQGRGTIIVADRNNHRLSEFTEQGQFLRNLVQLPSTSYPWVLSFSHPYLWLIDQQGTTANVYRYKLFEG